MAIDSTTACLSQVPKKCMQLGNFQFDINSPFKILFTRKLKTFFQESAQHGGFVGSMVRFCREQFPRGFSALARLYLLCAPNQNRHATQAIFPKIQA